VDRYDVKSETTSMNPATDTLLTVHETAKRLKVTSRTVFSYAKEGRIPKLKVGGATRFYWPDVLAAIRTHGGND